MNFSDLVGKTLVEVRGMEPGSDHVYFADTEGKRYEMQHPQDCCETVTIESVVGDVSDLLGEPLLMAEEVSGGDDPPGYVPSEYRDSYTWTFYKLATRKGYVDVRWLGESNGYYGESVEFNEVGKSQYEIRHVR